MAVLFAWDPHKDAFNRRKHGVSFSVAQLAFLDEHRVIAVDTRHGGGELRFYCFGFVAGRVLTVRSTIRGDSVRIFGAGFWRRGRRVYEERRRLHG